MAQIRSKQIADFLSSVQWSTVTSSQIANAADIKSYVSGEITELSSVQTAALSAEIAATNSDFVRVEAAYAAADSIETARAEAAELVLTNALSTEIAATNSDFVVVNASIDSLETKAGAEVDAINASVDSLETALSTEIAATNSDVTRIDGNVSTEKGRIDAILLASDADKDSFAEIVSLINAVDTTNDGALAAYVLSNNAALSAEISATDGDVTSINTRATNLESGLSAEISATNSDFVRVEAAYAAADSIEMARAEAAEEVLTNNLSTLSTEVVNEVASIDTRLGSVSGDLVSSVDSLETALTAEISATNSDFVRVEAAYAAADSVEKARAENAEGMLSYDIDVERGRAEAAELVLTNALSTEIAATNGEFISINSRVSIETGRIDAILLASDADKDSFVEIVSLINAVDTTNDGALAAYVLSNNAALSAEISATDGDFATVNSSIDSLELALSAEIVATNDDVTAINASIDSLETKAGAEVDAINASVDSLETALSAEIVATNSDVTRIDEEVSAEIARATSVEVTHDDRLTSLEGYIMEDAQEVIENFVGAGSSYLLSFAVQDSNKKLVKAYVNGIFVEVIGLMMGNFASLANTGYVIDENDNVTFIYQK